MMSLISAARMSMVDSLLGKLVADRAELGAEGAVVHGVADLRDDATEELGVFALGDGDLLARELLERGGDLRELRRIERLRGGDLGGDATGLCLDHRVELARDAGQRAHALAVEQEIDEVAHRRHDAHVLEQRVDHLAAVLAADRGRRQRRLQLGRILHRLCERADVGAQLVETALLRADLEDGLRVAARKRAGDHDALCVSTLLMNVLTRPRCSSAVTWVLRSFSVAWVAARVTSLVSAVRASSISAAIRCSASRLSIAAWVCACSKIRALSASASARIPSTSFMISSSRPLTRASFSSSFAFASSRSCAASSSAFLIASWRSRATCWPAGRRYLMSSHSRIAKLISMNTNGGDIGSSSCSVTPCLLVSTASPYLPPYSSLPLYEKLKKLKCCEGSGSSSTSFFSCS